MDPRIMAFMQALLSQGGPSEPDGPSALSPNAPRNVSQPGNEIPLRPTLNQPPTEDEYVNGLRGKWFSQELNSNFTDEGRQRRDVEQRQKGIGSGVRSNGNPKQVARTSALRKKASATSKKVG